jgi:hypothetical protein
MDRDSISFFKRNYKKKAGVLALILAFSIIIIFVLKTMDSKKDFVIVFFLALIPFAYWFWCYCNLVNEFIINNESLHIQKYKIFISIPFEDIEYIIYSTSKLFRGVFFIRIKMKEDAIKIGGITINFYRIDSIEKEKQIHFLEELNKRTTLKKS